MIPAPVYISILHVNPMLFVGHNISFPYVVK